MTQSNPEFWTEAAQQFQQSMTTGWAKALESFKTMDLGAAGAGMPALGKEAPEVHFSEDKVKALQQKYMQEAMGLFSQGMSVPDTKGDKRFADAAWASNPIAAYAAAVYMLNARTMMGLADAVDADDKNPHPNSICHRAMDGRRGTQQFLGV